MVYIRCDCDSDTFHLNFAPPLRCFAVCTDCGAEQEIGGADRADPAPAGPPEG